MKPLFDYISNKTNISQKAKDYITSISEIKKFDKNTVLIEQHKTVNKMYFVVDGCLRSFSYDKKGKEHTRSLQKVQRSALVWPNALKGKFDKLITVTSSDPTTHPANQQTMSKP